MPANSDTVVQLNFNTPGRTLINIYISDPETAEPLLRDVMELSNTIKEAEDLFGAVHVVQAALGGQIQQSYPSTQPAPQQAVSGTPEPAEKEFCAHGPMTWKSGVSKAGNNYSLWECSTGLKPEQGGCAVRWPKRGR
jgi:hypothetical protein